MAFYTNSLNFPNLTSKASPVAADIILIADSASGDVPKQATIGSLPFAPLGGATVVNITAATQAMASDTIYFVNYTGGQCVLTLPTAVNSHQGDLIVIIGGESNTTTYQIAQNALQQIRVLNQLTTAGIGGTLTSTTAFDWCVLRCDALAGGLTWAAMTNGNFNGA